MCYTNIKGYSVNIENKRAEVLTALQSREVSHSNIYNRNATVARKLIAGGSVPDQTIETMYQNLLTLRNQKASQQLPVSNGVPLAEALEENARLRSENVLLQAEVTSLRETLAEKAASDAPKSSESVLIDGMLFMGFHIRKEANQGVRFDKHGKKHVLSYLVYYAKKRVKGKLHRIYLGNSLERDAVREKISGYLGKHPELKEYMENCYKMD